MHAPKIIQKNAKKNQDDHLPDVVEHPRVGAEVEEVLHDLVVAALAGQVHRRRLLVDRVVLDGVGAGLNERLNDLKDDNS